MASLLISGKWRLELLPWLYRLLQPLTDMGLPCHTMSYPAPSIHKEQLSDIFAHSPSGRSQCRSAIHLTSDPKPLCEGDICSCANCRIHQSLYLPATIVPGRGFVCNRNIKSSNCRDHGFVLAIIVSTCRWLPPSVEQGIYALIVSQWKFFQCTDISLSFQHYRLPTLHAGTDGFIKSPRLSIPVQHH